MNIDLSDRNGYAIAAAIRGPDSESYLADTLKWIFTARIRCIAGASHVGLVRCQASDIDCGLEDVYSGIHSLSHANSEHVFDVIHFLSHVSEALYALRDMGIGDQKENALLLDLAHSIFLYAKDIGLYDRDNNSMLQRDIDTTLKEIIKLDQPENEVESK